jgi:hypothetical protein
MPKIRNKFECGHVGFGQFCHTCEQLKRGELIEIEQTNGPSIFKKKPGYVSESDIVQYILKKNKEQKGKRSKREIIKAYCKAAETTIDRLRREVGK